MTAGGGLPAIAALVVAPFVGSFLGVVIRRLPAAQPIARGRSRCEACGSPLRARDLVPLVSWLALRGRCRHCGRALGLFYPAVELAALAVAAIAVAVDPGGEAWLACGLGWWLLVLAWIDLRCWLLPDQVTLPLVAAGLGAAMLFDPLSLPDRLVGAAAGWLLFAAIAWLYRRLRRREGLGGGDAKLLAAAGAWVGAGALPGLILLAATTALAAALGLHLAGRRLRAASALPFGPFLALATWTIWLSAPSP